MHPKVVPFAKILIAGLPAPAPAPRPLLSARELSYCVELLGRVWTLKDALDRIQGRAAVAAVHAAGGCMSTPRKLGSGKARKERLGSGGSSQL